MIAASQAIDLIVGEVRKLTESASPLGNALPIMPIDDTLYFRQVAHDIPLRRTSRTECEGNTRLPGTKRNAKNLKA